MQVHLAPKHAKRYAKANNDTVPRRDRTRRPLHAKSIQEGEEREAHLEDAGNGKRVVGLVGEREGRCRGGMPAIEVALRESQGSGRGPGSLGLRNW